MIGNHCYYSIPFTHEKLYTKTKTMKPPEKLWIQQAKWNKTQFIGDTTKMFDDHELYIHRDRVVEMLELLKDWRKAINGMVSIKAESGNESWLAQLVMDTNDAIESFPELFEYEKLHCRHKNKTYNTDCGCMVCDDCNERC